MWPSEGVCAGPRDADRRPATLALARPHRPPQAAALARRVASILDEHPRGLPRLALHEEYERLHGVPYERACRAVEGGRGEAARALQRVCRSGAAMRAASKQLGVSPSAFRVDWVYRHRADALRVARGGSRRCVSRGVGRWGEFDARWPTALG